MHENLRSKSLCVFITAFAAGIPALSYSAPGFVSRSCLPVGAQESITVDWTFRQDLYWTASAHYKNGILQHIPNSGWSPTWRSYAGHLGSEFWYGAVVGYHWRFDTRIRQPVRMAVTTATDCNLRQWGF